MKTEELTALGLTDEQATQVLAIHGKDIEKHKKQIETLEGERDSFKTQFETADAALKKFEGIDPEKIQGEVQIYKTQLEDAKKDFAKQLTQRDQKDWLTAKLDEYGVKSPLARRQITAEVMSDKDGLKWKSDEKNGGTFLGFDEYMKAAKAEDNTLYLTAEEKEAAAKQADLEGKAPAFTGPTGDPAPQGKKFIPPKIF